MISKYLPLAAVMLAVAAPAAAVTVVTVEAPGALTTTFPGIIAVEDFDSQTIGNVVPANTSFAAIGVSATFTSTMIQAADQYTGAGGTGNGVAVRNTGDLDINFTGTPLNYFGVWASALDGANTVSIYQGTTLLSRTNLNQVALSGAYAGNPSGVFAGQNSGEKYAFFNFRVTEGFDRVGLSQNGGGGFELDNVTIGNVPEPQAWALLVLGFGFVGVAARCRKTVVAACIAADDH